MKNTTTSGPLEVGISHEREEAYYRYGPAVTAQSTPMQCLEDNCPRDLDCWPNPLAPLSEALGAKNLVTNEIYRPIS